MLIELTHADKNDWNSNHIKLFLMHKLEHNKQLIFKQREQPRQAQESL